MVSSIIYQLTKNLSTEEIECSGFDKYYVDHTLALWPQAAGESLLMPVSSSLKAIRSRICSKIWRQSKKPAAPTKIFSVSYTTPTYANRSVSSVQGKSSTSSVSVKAIV